MARLFAVVVVLCFAGIALGLAYDRESRSDVFLTAPVERSNIATVVKATGVLNPKISVDISSQLSGRIAEVLVGFNEEVKAGQAIARVDPEIYAARLSEAKAAQKVAEANAQVSRAALERADAALANARVARAVADAQLAASRIKQEESERQLQRKLTLARSGNVSESELSRARSQTAAEEADLRAGVEQIRMKDEGIAIAEAEMRMAEANIVNARAVVEQKQAAVEQAEVDLQRTILRAPIDGVVIKRDVNPGQTVAVSLEAKTLFKIVNDLREMEVHGRVDEADVGRVRVGQFAEFTVDAYPDQTFKGGVIEIRKSPEMVQNVVTYTVIVSASNQELLLFPGMTATLRILVSDTGPILKVPNQALRFRPDGKSDQPSSLGADGGSSVTVWTIDRDGRPEAVSIVTGLSDATGTQVLLGKLLEGQPVIVGVATSTKTTSLFGLRLGF
jgi:HlyD family secretion protein